MNEQTRVVDSELTDLGAASEQTLGVFQKYAEESTGLPDYRD